MTPVPVAKPTYTDATRLEVIALLTAKTKDGSVQWIATHPSERDCATQNTEILGQEFSIHTLSQCSVLWTRPRRPTMSRPMSWRRIAGEPEITSQMRTALRGLVNEVERAIREEVDAQCTVFLAAARESDAGETS